MKHNDGGGVPWASAACPCGAVSKWHGQPSVAHGTRPMTLPLMAAALLVISACDRYDGFITVDSREVMGTVAHLNVHAQTLRKANAAEDAAFARLDDVNRLMSDYVADSEIGQLNQLSAGESLVVSPETFHCLEQALDIARRTNGAFDPTCRPLVRLWRKVGKEKRLPTAEELAATRARVGWKHIQLDADSRRVTVLIDDLQIDLGGIAKGYGLDLAAEAMKRAGATAGLVDVGGDVCTFGRRENDQLWRIGVRDPFKADRTKITMTLELADAAVATSGDQERYYEIDGKRYSHIVDPRTGRPAEQAPSVTVIAPDGITADAWATVFSVLSVAEGQALLSRELKDAGVEVMWIAGSADAPQVTKTPGFDAYIAK